ncbi:MAG: translesion DNA synthesis-associated protein ImuA [Burkholderiales bacterium]
MDTVPAAVSPCTAETVAPRGAATRLDLDALHPALWRANQLGRGAGRALASGFAALDAQLPGGGWPRRALTELLLAHPGVGEMRLLAPSLAATLRAGRIVMLFDPPATLSAWALAQLGLDAERMLVIDGRSRLAGDPRVHDRQAGDSLWALEQALRSGHVGALLAWLPLRLRTERLRRLQLAAQSHDGPAFVLREIAVREHPSAAPLRLALQPAGADRLAVYLLKRRGPPLAAPLQLALPPVLSVAAQRKALMRAAAAGQTPRDEPLRAAVFIDLAAS